jgi:release factor glutamine methyltransferase
LLGTVDFLGRIFTSDARALIPRPETELLVDKLFKRHPVPPKRIVDVGTGSGVLALSLAAQWPDTEVHAVDISEQALALALHNATNLGLQDRVQFHQGSLLTPLSGTFDLIVANLPYIPSADISSLSREVQHDPKLALDGGPDGAVLIRELLNSAPQYLAGLLALEIGHDQSSMLAEALASGGYHHISPETDYQDRLRFLFASYG